MSTLAIAPSPSLERLAELSIQGLVSPCSRMSYRGYLKRFCRYAGTYPLSYELVASWLAHVRARGYSEGVVAQNMKAIKKLALECHRRRLISDHECAEIIKISVPSAKGVRAGNWMQLREVQALMRLPNRKTYKGCRDAATLGILVGCGLRRAEAAALTWSHYQQREGRWCFVDLTGKGNKIRTIPVPAWVAADIEKLRRYYKADERILAVCNTKIWEIVHHYMTYLAAKPGFEHCARIAPHDLRRTLAKLMRKAGTPLEQITLTLGHADLKTTMKYLNWDLELSQGNAGVDQVDIETEV